jgi:hypothetical protein
VPLTRDILACSDYFGNNQYSLCYPQHFKYTVLDPR